jgi:hypothetical protein
MFTRLAVRLPNALGHATPRVPSRLSSQARLMSRLAVDGSKGRAMPATNTRATAPASGVDATFTIRVRFPPTANVCAIADRSASHRMARYSTAGLLAPT